MTERRRDLGWLGVFTGMTGLILLVLLILIALGERVAGDAAPVITEQIEVVETGSAAARVQTAAGDAAVSLDAVSPAVDLAARLVDGEQVQVHFLSALRVTGVVQVANGIATILNPLGEAIDLTEVAMLVKADGQTIVPAELGIQPAPATVAPPLVVSAASLDQSGGEAASGTVVIASEPVDAVPVNSVPVNSGPVVVAVEAAPAASVGLQVEVNGLGDLPVSAILDQYPEGTLFTATLQNGEQVIAMKENRLKLVRVDLATGAASKTIVPPWMIESLTPVS